MKESINFFWFRRDLRLEDNAGLYHALKSGKPVQTIFIFDTNILDRLEDKNDRRVVFIHSQLERINNQLKESGSSLLTFYGSPADTWKKILGDFKIETVFANHDYEPYARKRDEEVNLLLKKNNVGFQTFKDQVIFEKDEIIKDDGKPYTVFTPYMNKWRKKANEIQIKEFKTEKYFSNFYKSVFNPVIGINTIGFTPMKINFPSSKPGNALLKNYSALRDFPAENGTSRIGVHVRFGTVSIRSLINKAWTISDKWINELIWREFYMMILWNFPYVTNKAFKTKFDRLPWLNNEKEFQFWCEGKTGYPLVDAGMRELNSTGFMHNRLRMITAMFLTKYLLIDWRWGEAYFAQKLLDFELASNNGGWQWSAGTGVDAAPYFRIFNMTEQAKRFDPDFTYIKKWVPELNDLTYPTPIIDYAFARNRCLEFYKKADL